jgi:hypothetical protein
MPKAYSLYLRERVAALSIRAARVLAFQRLIALNAKPSRLTNLRLRIPNFASYDFLKSIFWNT